MKHEPYLCRVLCLCAILGVSASASRAGQLPPDVRSNHWAAGSVEQILKSGVMTVSPDHNFHGEEHVTHIQAVIALAAVAKKLEAGTWPVGEVKPVPDKVEKTLTQTNWQSKHVTRFALASVLVRLGNYYAKAISRPKPGAKDLSKSEILPANVKIPASVTTSNLAYGSLKYLVDGKMVSANSALLKADSQLIKASELSQAVAEVVDGLANNMTELGHDEQGNTPDKSFHPGAKSPKK